MNRLKQITTKAKQLYKTGKYAKWTDAIKAASKQTATVGATKKKTAKKKAAPKKKTAVKKSVIKKVETKKKATTRNYGSHKDTGSHNVRISVVSGINKSIGKLERQYVAVFNLPNGSSDYEIFKAHSLDQAKKYAQFHKRMNKIKGTLKVHLLKK